MDEVNLAPDFIDRTSSAFGRIFGIFSQEHIFFIIIAAIPVIIWLYIFLRHQREKKLLSLVTFFGGILAVVPIFIFQQEISRIEGWLHITSSTILTIALSALWVGFYEETAKNWIVRSVGRKFFRNIDDAIQISIISALGFAFIENVLYFSSIWNNEAISNFWFYYAFRSLGSMFLHIFASGTFGYYYGIAHFAKPVLKDQLAQGKKFIFTRWFHKILHLKSETVFHEEKVIEGLMLAASSHAVFDFMMGMSQYYSDSGSSLAAKFWLIIAVPFLVFGYFWLTSLLDKKENLKIYREVCEKEECDILDERSKIEKIIKGTK